MKLCVFQGTFNPIHNAHLRVAEYIAKVYTFDNFLFIPACDPPHKSCNPDYAKDRLEMVKLALEDRQRFEVSDIEYERCGKSYTYLTIKELYKRYEVDGKIHFVIGTDAFKHIESWYKTNELKKFVKFVVFVREDSFDISEYDYLKAKDYDFEFQPLPYQDISSTELRQKIKRGEDISGYVPVKVEEYIKNNGLYKD